MFDSKAINRSSKQNEDEYHLVECVLVILDLARYRWLWTLDRQIWAHRDLNRHRLYKDRL